MYLTYIYRICNVIDSGLVAGELGELTSIDFSNIGIGVEYGYF